MRDFLSFEPLYQERVWGGRALEQSLGRRLPAARPIGESWEIVDRPEAQSVVKEGPYRGLSLRQLVRDHGREFIGPGWDPERPFPLLVKWLDCRERLSLQVHPPAPVASELGGEPKTENWYVAEAVPGAQLIVGLTPGMRPAEFEAAIGTGTLETCVRRFPVGRGDSILVHSGEVHAIDAGNLILEIQQNSDTTYRVHDWGRVGLDGKPRQMHLKESLQSIRWTGEPLQPVRAAPVRAVIADCREFRIERIPLASGERLQMPSEIEARLFSVVEGQVGTWRRGANLVVPYSGAVDVVAAEPSLVLVTTHFARA